MIPLLPLKKRLWASVIPPLLPGLLGSTADVGFVVGLLVVALPEEVLVELPDDVLFEGNLPPPPAEGPDPIGGG